MFNIETILNFLMIIFKKILLESLCFENIYTNSNAVAKFFQIYMNILDQMTPRKKYILDNWHFLIKYCLAHTNKNATKKSYQNNRLYTKQQNFCVSLLRKTKKKALFEFK